MDTRELQPAGMDAWDMETETESLYRFRAGSHIIYVVVQPRCILLDRISDYGFPIAIRNLLPATISPSHNLVEIASDGTTVSSCRQFTGVETIWHLQSLDVTNLPVVQELKTGVFKVKYGTSFAVAKIARFEFEIPYIEKETHVYRDINGHDVGPRFLAHLTEEGRTMGILLEYLPGRTPTRKDFSACAAVLTRLHNLGWTHGDVNRHNFLVNDGEARLIDFDSVAVATNESMKVELERMSTALQEYSTQGAQRCVVDAELEEGCCVTGI
jgi:predicted Ser/Thr protein kinase